MNIIVELTDGPVLGIEFIDKDIKCVLHLLFVRVLFVSMAFINKFEGK